MKLIKILFLALILIGGINSVFCQNTQDKNDLIKKTDSAISKKQTSLKTDILPEVFQTAINNGIISTSGTSIKLNTTIFGLKKLFNPNVIIDTNYIKETFNRNFSFGGGINIDNTNKINGAQSSIKWAIVNNRDVSVIDNEKFKVLIDTLNQQTNNLTIALNEEISEKIESAERKNLITKPEDSLIKKALKQFSDSTASENSINNLKQVLINYINTKKIDIDPSIFDIYPKKRKLINQLADSLQNLIKKGALLTFSFTSNYINKNWDSLSFKLEYIKGIGGQKDSTKPWDIYAGAFYNFKQDTVLKQNLQRQILSLKLGLNKVFATRDDGSPLFEVLGAAEYDNITSGHLYPDEKRSTLLADFTFTIKVSKAVSIPLEIKYDPTNKGNLYGFLNLKWDILTSPSK